MCASRVRMCLRSEPGAIASINAAADEEAVHLGELGRDWAARHQPRALTLELPRPETASWGTGPRLAMKPSLVRPADEHDRGRLGVHFRSTPWQSFSTIKWGGDPC